MRSQQHAFEFVPLKHGHAAVGAFAGKGPAVGADHPRAQVEVPQSTAIHSTVSGPHGHQPVTTTPAVHDQRLAGHHAAGIRGQEQDRVHHVLRRKRVFQALRARCASSASASPTSSFCLSGQHPARRQRVDPDPVGGRIPAPGCGSGRDAGICRRVGRVACIAHHVADREKLMIEPPPALRMPSITAWQAKK